MDKGWMMVDGEAIITVIGRMLKLLLKKVNNCKQKTKMEIFLLPVSESNKHIYPRMRKNSLIIKLTKSLESQSQNSLTLSLCLILRKLSHITFLII